MKIAHLVNLSRPIGEGNIYAAKTCEYLAKLGHEVTLHLLCRTGESRELAALLPEKVRLCEIASIDFKRQLPTDLRYLPYPLFLRRWRAYDIINVHSYLNPEFLFTYFLARLWNIPVVLTHTQLDPRNRFGPEGPSSMWRHLFAWRSRALKNTAGVVLYNSVYRDAFIGLGVDEKKIRSIPPGVDNQYLEPNGEDNGAVRRKYRLRDEFIIAFVGRFRPKRGIETVFRAFPIIRKKYPGTKLLMVGGPEEEYKRLCSELMLGDDVIFTGYQPNNSLPSFYGAADICVWLPSPPGTFGMVLLEAMACGKPVIGSKTDSIMNLIRNGENGFLIDHDDEHHLARVIGRLIEHKSLRIRMGENGRRLVRTNFRWEYTAEKHEEFFRELAGLYGKNGFHRTETGKEVHEFFEDRF